MLTAAKQWKILKKEEEKTGRKRWKTKGLLEQLKDMGGFGDDPDSEQAIIEELKRRDTRAPLEYPQASTTECEVFFGQSSFFESRKRLFHSWLFQARRQNSWMEEKDLPFLFRFALRRPIMDERSFTAMMEDMNLQLETSTGDARQPYSRPVGRSRQLMFGIDVDKERDHVSNRFKTVLPKGSSGDMDRARDEAMRVIEDDDDDLQEIVRRQLMTIHEHVQNGSVAIETAAWHYRDAFNNQDISDEALIICLDVYGIPTDHIPTSERNARRSSTHRPDSSSGSDFRHYSYAETMASTTMELANLIQLFRQGILHELEAVNLIKQSLNGLHLESNTISDMLDDFNIDVETAAKLMWEDSVDYDDDLDYEEEEEESHQDQKNPLRPQLVPDPPAKEEESDDAENAPKQPKEKNIGKQLMGPPVLPPAKLSTYSHVDEVESMVLPPGTPRPKPMSLARNIGNSDSQADKGFDRQPPSDRAPAGPREPSPDEGMTTGIWGLLMPTKEARKIAYTLKLPQETIDLQVRSISPRRISKRRASHAKTIVTFPKSKRKASMVLHKDAPPKSPKHTNYSDHSDFFAREGEDQETFVLSHFDHEHIRSKTKCLRCLPLPCECEDRSSPRLITEPECFKCLQQPCMCAPLSRLNQATQTAGSNNNPSSDALEAKLVDRTRPKSPEQPVTMLTYLSRRLNDNDMLTSIKQLERTAKEDTAVADAMVILDLIEQGVDAGVYLDTTGEEDQEAVRILDAMIQSSQVLADYAEKFKGKASRDNTSTTGADDCRDEVEEALDSNSSSLNSKPDYERLPTPPRNQVDSATNLQEAQSNIANGAMFQAINKPFPKYVSPYLPTPALNSTVPQPEPSSKSVYVVQPSRSESVPPPESSAAGDLSRAESRSISPPGGKFSTAELSEQVSDCSVDAKNDPDDNFGVPLMRQPHSTLHKSVESDFETRPPPPPRPRAKELPNIISSASLRAAKKKLGDSIPPPPPKLSLKRSPEILPHGETFEEALEHAKEEAFRQRKSFAFYLEERRAVRTRIKKEKGCANSKMSDHSFFQSSNGLSGSSNTASISALNKLFDKYRGMSSI